MAVSGWRDLNLGSLALKPAFLTPVQSHDLYWGQNLRVMDIEGGVVWALVRRAWQGVFPWELTPIGALGSFGEQRWALKGLRWGPVCV